jgi:hypothetical protein
MTVTLLWKCNELIVTQRELLRYYSNATTDLTCHIIINEACVPLFLDRQSDSAAQEGLFHGVGLLVSYLFLLPYFAYWYLRIAHIGNIIYSMNRIEEKREDWFV